MPLNLIREKLPWELQEDYGYPNELMDIRKEIHEQFKI